MNHEVQIYNDLLKETKMLVFLSLNMAHKTEPYQKARPKVCTGFRYCWIFSPHVFTRLPLPLLKPCICLCSFISGRAPASLPPTPRREGKLGFTLPGWQFSQRVTSFQWSQPKLPRVPECCPTWFSTTSSPQRAMGKGSEQGVLKEAVVCLRRDVWMLGVCACVLSHISHV